MSTLTQVAEALAARARTIPGMNARPYVSGSGEWPGAFVQPVTVDYEALSNDDEDFRLELVVMVGAMTDQAQLKLFKYIDVAGAHSVPALIQADRGLGLGDVDALVVPARALGLQEQAAYQGYGCAFEVVVRL